YIIKLLIVWKVRNLTPFIEKEKTTRFLVLFFLLALFVSFEIVVTRSTGKNLQLIFVVVINYDIRYRSGNTLRSPGARDEPPHSQRTLAVGSHRLRFPTGQEKLL